jgi:hypothetical protein
MSPRSLARNALGLLLTGLVLAACQDPYLARRDTLTVGSGEAVHANIAKQVIDPWPAHAQRIEPTMNGERAQRAMERYRNPGAGPGAGAPPPVPLGPPGAPIAAPPSFR